MFDRYSAIRKSPTGQDVYIITVLADDVEEARKRLHEELSKDGREPMLHGWLEDGLIIKKKRPFQH